MPDKPDETTRTLKPDDRDAADSTRTTGTPAEDERDAQAGGDDFKALTIAQKQTIEDLKRENAELKESVTAGHTPAAGRETELQSEIEDNEREIAELTRLAAVDPVARRQLRQERAIQQMRHDTMDALILARVPEEKQPAVVAFYNKHRQHFDSLSDVLRYVKGREAETENAKLKDQVKELERKIKGEDKDTDVVRTGGRDLSTSQATARKTTRSDFQRRQLELKRAGDYDGARKEQGKLRRGEIVYTD